MRRLAALLAAAALLAGCGGGSSTSVLSKTASNLGKIRSGTISFGIVVTPRGSAGGSPFGFRMRGPLAFARSGSLPVADVRYTQIANGKQATVTLVTDGKAGWIEVSGKAYALPDERLSPLRSALGSLQGKQGGLREIRIDRWIESPKLSDGGTVGGAGTDHVHARLNVVRALGDLGVSRPVAGEDAKRLARATRASTIDVWTGKKDRLLRRLTLDVEFGLDVPKSLRRALGRLVGAHVVVELGVAHPNAPVHVTAPANPLPYSALPKG
jgi:hypothetical protein